MGADPVGENGGINLFAFVENDPINMSDCYGLVTVKRLSKSITWEDHVRHGYWGWTDVGYAAWQVTPAEIKYDSKRKLYFVSKKPELTITIPVYTAERGKQDWKEELTLDDGSIQLVAVYIDSRIANASEAHESARFYTWKEGLTSFYSKHFEDAALQITGQTREEVVSQITELYRTAGREWLESAELAEVSLGLVKIGLSETIPVTRWVRKRLRYVISYEGGIGKVK